MTEAATEREMEAVGTLCWFQVGTCPGSKRHTIAAALHKLAKGMHTPDTERHYNEPANDHKHDAAHDVQVDSQVAKVAQGRIHNQKTQAVVNSDVEVQGPRAILG